MRRAQTALKLKIIWDAAKELTVTSDEPILVSVEKSSGSFLYIIEEQSETQEDGWNVDASG